MLKHIILKGVIAMSLLSFLSPSAQAKPSGNAYQFEFKNLDEDGFIKLADYAGKVVLIVNTASECGFTKQYKGLQELYAKYKEKDFVVIGVPSNDFGAQEPGTAKEIAKFCEINYGVTFPLTAKQVVSGDSAHPFYLWAKETLGFGTAPKWNFHKYLIGKDGALIDYFNSTTAPDSDKIISAIEAELDKK
jgi:glutathione peroxidase